MCSLYGFYLHMRLLKPSNKFMQIVLMRWINRAFMLGPQNWVWLITLKKQPNIQNIFKEVKENYQNITFKRCMGTKTDLHTILNWILDTFK